MNESFSVGEIAIAVGWQHWKAKYNGGEVEVIGGLGEYKAEQDGDGLRYAVLCDGKTFYPLPTYLRKKKPKAREETTTWDQCIWKPKQVTA